MIAILSDWTQEQAGQVVLIGAAIGVFVKWVIVPLYRAAKAAAAAAEFIQHELKENSGRSLRDYAVRTDARIEYLFERQGIDMPDHLRTPPPEKP